MKYYTPLAEYALQRGLSRQRIYQIKQRLTTVDLPVFAEQDGKNIQLTKDGQPLIQTFVVQTRQQLEQDLQQLQAKYDVCATRDAYRLGNMIRVIKNILK